MNCPRQPRFPDVVNFGSDHVRAANNSVYSVGSLHDLENRQTRQGHCNAYKQSKCIYQVLNFKTRILNFWQGCNHQWRHIPGLQHGNREEIRKTIVFRVNCLRRSYLRCKASSLGQDFKITCYYGNIVNPNKAFNQ